MSIAFPFKNKRFVYVYVLTGIYIYINLFFGISNFATTFFTYTLLGILSYKALTYFSVRTNIKLLFYALIGALFLSEVAIRYIIRYPLSYGEQNGGSYILVDYYQRKSNIRFKYLEGRKDLYTLEFDPGEIRYNDCGDYQYANDTCNALGLRGKLPAKEKNIVLVLGDSFTEGAGAPADSTIPSMLGDYFAFKDSALGVINAGIAGNDIFFDWKMLQKIASKYTVRQVFFILNATDINDVATRGGNERFNKNGLLTYNKQPWWEPIYAVSYVFRLISHNVLKLNYNLLSPEQQNARNAEALHAIRTLIAEEILPWCNTRQIDPIFVTFPLTSNLTNNIEYTKLTTTLKDIAHLRLINCYDSVASHPLGKNLYWPNDLHFTSEGYKTVTNCIIANYNLNFDQQ